MSFTVDQTSQSFRQEHGKQYFGQVKAAIYFCISGRKWTLRDIQLQYLTGFAKTCPQNFTCRY